MATKGDSGLQIPIFAFLAGTVLIVSALRGQTIVDVIAGTASDALDPKGHSRSATGTVNSQGVVSTSDGVKDLNAVTGQRPDNTHTGSPVPGQSYHSPTHPTSGLPGYPAYDYMAPAGTPCVAPTAGTITRLSGKDPKLGGPSGGALGYSIYLKGDNGKTYFMTHLDKVIVVAGQKVRQGQQIAEVAAGPASWSSPHVHMGVKG